MVSLFAVIWAWIGFAWFASAYDTDDWLYRLLTLVQMVGVVVVAIGITPFFVSLHETHGDAIDNTIMVLGYVVMRVGLCLQWVRAYIQAPDTRPGVIRYLTGILIAQVGWVALAFAHTSLRVFAIAGGVLIVIELLGPFLAEHAADRAGRAMVTPWHPHHIAERYSLLVIVTLGEGIVGTVSALSSAVEESGWTLQAWLVVLAGLALTFALWWVYFGIEWAQALHAHPERGFGWGYGHIPLFMGVAGTGAGLHIAGYVIAGEAGVTEQQAVLAVLIPVALCLAMKYLLFNVIFRTFDRVHLLLIALTAAVLAGVLLASRAGLSMGWALLLCVLAPAVSVIGHETVGHRHQQEHLRDGN